MVADPHRFPRGGIAALVRYNSFHFMLMIYEIDSIHFIYIYVVSYMRDLNMSLGLYSDMGTKTCAGYPGSEGFEVSYWS